MKASIERLWERPRTPVADNQGSSVSAQVIYFSCEAQVRQDAAGNVLEVLLVLCNGSPTWQRSLVSAIYHASPLPAPPDASVFSDSVTLHFIAYNYTNGMPEDEYESLATRTLEQ